MDTETLKLRKEPDSQSKKDGRPSGLTETHSHQLPRNYFCDDRQYRTAPHLYDGQPSSTSPKEEKIHETIAQA